VAVKLQAGRIVMPKALASTGVGHLIRWYCERARPGRWAKVQDYAAGLKSRPVGAGLPRFKAPAISQSDGQNALRNHGT